MSLSARNLIRIVTIVIAIVSVASVASHSQILAPTPPMGWNSWDAYGFTIDEAGFKANVSVLASIKQYGWKYAVIDEGWFLQDPFADKPEKQGFVFDANGRLIPAVNRFPSAATNKGLKPLADWVHGQGLKFGIHLIRGIPRESVRENKPIAGSKFTASEAADTNDVCPWNADNYGIRDNAAGQAWYDSIIALYASWGVDFFKVDCISDRPYKASEIRQVAAAIKKTGRPIVLSLSPGPTALDHAAEVEQYSQMWRISDDHWDVWSHVPKEGEGEFPMGTLQAFTRLFAWQSYVKPGRWPDEDMLALGSLTPHPGWGEARESHLTQDEQRTEFTLWAITRSPLIFGGNLTKLDEFTRGLLTNKAVLDMNQQVTGSHMIVSKPLGFEKTRVWMASAEGFSSPRLYLAVFNLDDKPVTLHTELENLSLSLHGRKLRDLWNGTQPGQAGVLDVTLPAHGCALYAAE